MLFKDEQKLEYVIHVFIVQFMDENYNSGDVKFSLCDVRGHG